MIYYKIISNAQIIGVSTSEQCYYFQEKHYMLERTLDNKAEYIECSGTLYHALWMLPIKTDLYSYQIADVIIIEEQEYNILAPLSEPIPVIEEEEEQEEVSIKSIDTTQKITTEYVRSLTLNNINYECRKTIEAGFDWKDKHYSLTTQDQLNLTDLNMLADVLDEIPYHADGEEVKLYSAAEIKELAAEATKFKIYQTTYYNSLKNYVNSLQTIEEIADITYGMEIPEEYKTEALKSLEG